MDDIFNRGGNCTYGPGGKWCYVDSSNCKDAKPFNQMFISTAPCKSSPCVCNGYTDLMGGGGSCGKWCYIEQDANCPDPIPYNGRMVSQDLCMDSAKMKISSTTPEMPKV